MLDFQLSTVIFTVLNLLILYVVLRKLLFGRVNRIPVSYTHLTLPTILRV